MAIPDFTAEAAVYRTSGSYRTAPRAGALATDAGATARIYPAIGRPVILDPYSSGGGEGGEVSELGGTCSSSCCANCTCCANFGHTGCCRYCNSHCS